MRVRKVERGIKTVIPIPYELEGPATAECPVSAITQRSVELAQIVNTMMSVNKAAGVAMGLDSMPGYLADAVRIAQQQSRAQETAQDEAVENS